MTHKLTPTLLGLLLLLACDDREGIEPVDPEAAEAEAPPVASRTAAAPSRTRHPADPEGEPREHLAQARPVVPGAKAAFEQLVTLVDTKYVGGPLSEDALWTAAMEGVLARLEQLPGHEINTLLPPRAHQELLVGTSGHLVGVGIMIERVADVVVVREVIAGGPAERAGLQAGDRILAIDGERTKTLELAAVVDQIRGAEGSTVELFVQRDTEEWTETITRGLVEVPSVQASLVRDGVGYLRITSFSKQTTAELDEQLAALARQGATRLVLDLRHCPGGLLEPAVETLGRFVPPGKPVLTIHPREGEPDVRRSEGEHASQAWPLAVLIGHDTASGAEIVADALREHDRAVLVGEPTLGKHTIEAIHELPEGWAVKLSVSRFVTASGQTEQGVGVAPDIGIPTPPDAEPGGTMVPIDQLDPAGDAVLGAAIELLRD
jgi:carboxyl-terminal processing protease